MQKSRRRKEIRKLRGNRKDQLEIEWAVWVSDTRKAQKDWGKTGTGRNEGSEQEKGL